MSDRDSMGRFVKGNKVCLAGWSGLVRKRFGGDEECARRWWGLIAAYYYAKAAVGGTVLERTTPFYHPGTPEQFLMVQYSQDVNFYG